MFGPNNEFEIISGRSKDGGIDCEPAVSDQCECEGGVIDLKVTVDGDVTGGNITATGKGALNVTASYIGTATVISITNNGEKLGTNLTVETSAGTGEIHVSCSQPIWIGKTFGDTDQYEVTDGHSRDGGQLCSEPYTKSATIENPVAFEAAPDIEAEENCSLQATVYPIPVTDNATISFVPAFDDEAIVELYNYAGQKAAVLYKKHAHKGIPVTCSFNVHKYTDKAYIVVIRNGSLRESIPVTVGN